MSDLAEKISTIYGQFYSWKDDLISGQLKQYSAHTRNELAMLKSLTEEGDNIIDIGAHIGTFSIPFAIFNNRKGKIFSFEANPNNYKLLKLNISENGLDDVIIAKNTIVTDETKEFTMLLPDTNNSGFCCFLPRNDLAGLPTATIGSTNIDEWHSVNAPASKIDLIKIDIEGAEMAAVCSCKGIIKKYLPIMYIEICKTALAQFNSTASDIEDRLKCLGYHLFKNIGPRNSNNDFFEVARLDNIEDGGDFFDLLAIHPLNHKYRVLRAYIDSKPKNVDASRL